MSTDTSLRNIQESAQRINAWVKSSRPSEGDVWLDELTLDADEWQAIQGYEWAGVELIEGRIRMAPSPSDRHQRGALQLASILNTYVSRNGQGVVMVAPSDLHLAGDIVVQPDMFWLPHNHPRVSSFDVKDTTPPSLVVEVLSPSNFRYDLNEKREIYAKAEIPHYWIVDPMRRDIEALELREAEYHAVGGVEVDMARDFIGTIFQAPPFPELEIDLKAVFPWGEWHKNPPQDA